MSNVERRDYIDAVHCLLNTPSKSDPTLVPGARNRYDDFVAVHINQTLSIHGTVSYSDTLPVPVHGADELRRVTF
jgi:tyrosinase